MPELSGAEAIRAGQYVRSSRCGRWVSPSDPAWLPTERGRVECSLCVKGIDFGPGVTYPAHPRIRAEAKVMSWYIVDLACKCGRVHRVVNWLQIPDGPTQAGSLAELYPAGDLPQVLIRLLGDLIWCDAAGDYIPIEEPGRLELRPRSTAGLRSVKPI